MTLETLLGGLIALAFLFSVLSLIASGIEEWWARLNGLRARMLECYLPVLVSRKTLQFTWFTRVAVVFRSASLPSPPPSSLVQALKAHPLIHGLRTDDRFPAYIPSANFALALLELTVKDPVGATGAARTPIQLKKQGDAGYLLLARREKQLLESLILDDTNLRSVQARIEKWFDDSTARVTEYYKRIAQARLLAVSVLLSFAFKVDGLAIVKHVFIDNAGPLFIPLGWNDNLIGPLASVGCLLSAFCHWPGRPVLVRPAEPARQLAPNRKAALTREQLQRGLGRDDQFCKRTNGSTSSSTRDLRDDPGREWSP